ncbi:MAG: glycoside hydrolase family 3 C-terminal domain-containing protein [Bifidobacterium dentium]
MYTLEYDDGTPHQLAVTKAERAMLDYAKANCKGVVVVLNTTNTMQVTELQDDKDINAIMQIATPGAMGFKSLGKILNGSVNPSARIRRYLHLQSDQAADVRELQQRHRQHCVREHRVHP